jgi:NADH dehydrogenase
LAVRDAGVTRLYKDGIGAALVTARHAALVVVNHGVSGDALHRHYLPFLRSLHRDNRLGHAIFAVHHRLKDSPSIFRAQSRLVDAERRKGGKRPFHRVFWGLFTGSYSYRSILSTALRPLTAGRLIVETAKQKLKGPALPHTRIVVLGGGFGGVYTTLHLERALRKQRDVKITLISQENFFQFTPLLHEVATGGVETRHIVQPIRSLQKGRRFSFFQARVEKINLERKQVLTSHGHIAYDYLALALGAAPDTHRLQGSAPYLFFLNNLYDGLLLRNHIIGMFEEAATQGTDRPGRLTLTVVGGGPTGVQLIAEIRDFVIRSILKNYPVSPSQVRFLLIQNEDRLLEEMDPRLGRYALKTLTKKGVEVLLGSRVTRLLPEGVEIDHDKVVPTGTLIWTVGIRASPVVEDLSPEKDDRGRIRVDRYLEVAGEPGVYALGDNASFVDVKTGHSLPARAHIAVR